MLRSNAALSQHEYITHVALTLVAQPPFVVQLLEKEQIISQKQKLKQVPYLNYSNHVQNLSKCMYLHNLPKSCLARFVMVFEFYFKDLEQ